MVPLLPYLGTGVLPVCLPEINTPLLLTEFVAVCLLMRQQLECEVARPGYEAAAVLGLALGVSVCVNVRGTSPVSLRPEETMAIHTVCVIHLAEGGSNYLYETVSKQRKRPQVSSGCENLLAVKSTYTLWNPLTCLHCFITRSLV